MSESTIQSYLGHLKAILNWAVDQKLLRACPKFPKIRRTKKSKAKKAGVVVHVSPTDPEKVKYASAHDFRRAFGERCAARVMPKQLQELMWHESIETTHRYYVGRNAERTADVCWEAFERAQASAAGTRPPQALSGSTDEPRESRARSP